MANNEDYLDALTAYSKNPSDEIPPVLDQYLNRVAKNGETLFQWQLLKPLIVGKMEQVLEDLRQRLSSETIPERPNVENLRFDVMRDRIMDALQKFNGAPFTIQRLCELLIDPKRHYKRSDKFMRGLEKNVLVVSTVDPYGSRSHSDFFCRKVVSESGSKHLVNGVDTNGSPFFPRDSNISSNLPPVPGWVTTTATTTTRPPSTLTADTSEQKLTQKPSQDFPTSATGGNSVTSMFTEHSEQQPVVQSEEVVEETVVTMDTNEASTVATDGGEAMAEEDDDEEEMTDDTNASSSSSSPEEQPVSDASESPGARTEITTVTSSRSWTESTKDGEDEDSASSNIDSYPSVTDSSENSERLSTELPPDKQTDSPPSSVVNSSHNEQPEDDVADNFTESEPEASIVESVEESLNNNTCGSVDTSATDTTEHGVSHKDAQHLESKENDSGSVTAPEESDSSATDSDDKTLPLSSPTQTTASIVDHLQPHEPSSSNTCIGTEVNASSSNDSISRNITALNSSLEECDNVAGLERLVDSVEPCPAQTSPSSSDPVPTLSPTTTSQNTEQPECSPMSSFGFHIDTEEPQAKRCKLLDDASSPSSSFMLSSTVEPASLEMDASPSDDAPVEADMAADTTSDSFSQIPAASSWNENNEAQESPDAVSCSENDSDIPANVTDSSHENAASPPSQLVSSGDSQGFDAMEDMAHKNNADEKQADEQLTSETSELETTALEAEGTQEQPMDQE